MSVSYHIAKNVHYSLVNGTILSMPSLTPAPISHPFLSNDLLRVYDGLSNFTTGSGPVWQVNPSVDGTSTLVFGMPFYSIAPRPALSPRQIEVAASGGTYVSTNGVIDGLTYYPVPPPLDAPPTIPEPLTISGTTWVLASGTDSNPAAYTTVIDGSTYYQISPNLISPRQIPDPLSIDGVTWIGPKNPNPLPLPPNAITNAHFTGGPFLIPEPLVLRDATLPRATDSNPGSYPTETTDPSSYLIAPTPDIKLFIPEPFIFTAVSATNSYPPLGTNVVNNVLDFPFFPTPAVAPRQILDFSAIGGTAVPSNDKWSPTNIINGVPSYALITPIPPDPIFFPPSTLDDSGISGIAPTNSIANSPPYTVVNPLPYQTPPVGPDALTLTSSSSGVTVYGDTSDNLLLVGDSPDRLIINDLIPRALPTANAVPNGVIARTPSEELLPRQVEPLIASGTFTIGPEITGAADRALTLSGPWPYLPLLVIAGPTAYYQNYRSDPGSQPNDTNMKSNLRAFLTLPLLTFQVTATVDYSVNGSVPSLLANLTTTAVYSEAVSRVVIPLWTVVVYSVVTVLVYGWWIACFCYARMRFDCPKLTEFPLLDFAVATVNGVGDKAFAHRPGLGWDWDVEMYRETLQKRVFFYRESKVEMKAGCKGTLKY